MQSCLALLFSLVAALAAAPALGQGQALNPQLEGPALIEALKKGGYVILMRHTSTDSFVPMPDSIQEGDCGNQRNLSDAGRAQAEAIGRAIAKLGIKFDEVFSSPFCRCVSTAKLAFGKVTEDQMLSVGDNLTLDEKDSQGAQIRKRLNTKPAAGENTVLITHTGNLLYSFGLQTRPEGIAHVFRPGVVVAQYVGYLEPQAWPAVAGIAADTP
jgi:phosphohistidine phosphatase SixA